MLALKQAYITSFPEKIQQLEQCWQNIQSSQFSNNEIEVMRALSHKIAGSSGSYEFIEISHAANELEHLCMTVGLKNVSTSEKIDIEKSMQELLRRLESYL